MNKTRLSRSAALIGAAALVGVSLTGCGGAKETDTSSKGSENQVTLEVWDYLGQGVSNEAMEASVAAFEKANPNIKIKRTSFAYADLSTSIVQGGIGGSLPDVAIADVVDTQNFASLTLLMDVTDNFAEKSNEFFDGPWSSTQFNGKTVALPLNSNNLALYYNKAMFKGAGVEVPTTWQELHDTGKVLARDGKSALAISAIKSEQGSFQVLPFVWQTGGDLKNYDKSGAEALTYLKRLIDDGVMSSSVTNYTQEDARTQFVTENVAMMINGPWELQNLKAENIDFGVAMLPKGAESATGLGGENILAFAGSKHPEEAKKFMEFMALGHGTKTYLDKSGQLTARKDLSGALETSKDENMAVFEAQMEYARARAYGGEYNKISEAIQISIQAALTGSSSPEDAAKTAADAIKPLLPTK
ncbi:sugar ABC transporter substrate-binding protein [Trueperella pyogenes]|uniref:sugar ABC transporter substrate-binding protein n=1 Tax=Trueperella pyogenes TaxID=1661 RepID=UPI00043AD6A9|nr:sugar ABC transporter substrate-binding protein [Trueperella pyogenes]AHU90089.1 sugar ABC transporter substrate-binding protein [Trueperella pyogenes]OQD32958.1 sugar ABC transporter substrate-binding protein [Trueperella pyogenes]